MTMSGFRLIDANGLDHAVVKAYTWKDLTAEEIKFRDMIAAAPTIDAVQVVRCRDCTHLGTCDCPLSYSVEWGIGQDNPGENDFCSRGERRRG